MLDRSSFEILKEYLYSADIIVFDVGEIYYCNSSDLHSVAAGHYACSVNKLHREAILLLYPEILRK